MTLDRRDFSGNGSKRLHRRSDEFSEQFSDPEDPHFWLRIAAPFSTQIVFTDLMFGSYDDHGMANALSNVLAMIGFTRPQSLTFTKLGSPDEFTTGRTVARIRQVLEIMVLRQRRFITDVRTEVVRGSVNLTVSFQHFD